MEIASEDRTRYHKDVPTLSADHPWHRVHARVNLGSTVLDIGCGSGGLGQLLMGTASAVDGVEANPLRAQEARKCLRSVVTGFAGTEVDQTLDGPYDVVVFADVLEHIVEPEPILAWASTKLAADGKILALIPNSANWKFRRKILKGDWSYAETGYFDRDHVRFFDVETARALIDCIDLVESGLEFVPERLPKPVNTWVRGAQYAANLRPNLFAGHLLLEWSRSS